MRSFGWIGPSIILSQRKKKLQQGFGFTPEVHATRFSLAVPQQAAHSRVAMKRQFGWLMPSILIAQKKKKVQHQGFGAPLVHHSRMVEHWSNLVEANTKITAQSLAIGACRKAAYSFMQAAMAVGALGAHVASGPPDEHMGQVIRAYRQDLVNLSDRLAKCKRG